MRRTHPVGNVPVTATGVAAGVPARGGVPDSGETAGPAGDAARMPLVVVARWATGRGAAMGGIGSTRQDLGADRVVTGSIPSQRTAADAYRVSDDQLHRARLVVARNSGDSDDLRQLLDMLGLISNSPDQPPPVSR